jgi:hypothetical protein
MNINSLCNYFTHGKSDAKFFKRNYTFYASCKYQFLSKHIQKTFVKKLKMVTLPIKI